MKNSKLRILYTYNGIFLFAGTLLGPIYAVYVNKINADILAITWSVIANILAETIFTFIVGKFGDKKENIKEILMLGYLVRAVAWVLFVIAHDMTSVILLQILIGIGQGLANPAFDAIFAEHLEDGSHMADYSQWHIIGCILIIGATFVGGLTAKYLGFDILFVIMALLGLVSFFGVYFSDL